MPNPALYYRLQHRNIITTTVRLTTPTGRLRTLPLRLLVTFGTTARSRRVPRGQAFGSETEDDGTCKNPQCAHDA
jgi:hypothetical protein